MNALPDPASPPPPGRRNPPPRGVDPDEFSARVLLLYAAALGALKLVGPLEREFDGIDSDIPPELVYGCEYLEWAAASLAVAVAKGGAR